MRGILSLCTVFNANLHMYAPVGRCISTRRWFDSIRLLSSSCRFQSSFHAVLQSDGVRIKIREFVRTSVCPFTILFYPASQKRTGWLSNQKLLGTITLCEIVDIRKSRFLHTYGKEISRESDIREFIKYYNCVMKYFIMNKCNTILWNIQCV